MPELAGVSRKELAEALEGAPVPIHWVDAEGVIVWANRAELELLGYDRSEYIGRPIADFHENKSVIADILARLLRGEKVDAETATLIRKDGHKLDVVIDSNPYCVNDSFVHSRCFTRLTPSPVPAGPVAGRD